MGKRNAILTRDNESGSNSNARLPSGHYDDVYNDYKIYPSSHNDSISSNNNDNEYQNILNLKSRFSDESQYNLYKNMWDQIQSKLPELRDKFQELSVICDQIEDVRDDFEASDESFENALSRQSSSDDGTEMGDVYNTDGISEIHDNMNTEDDKIQESSNTILINNLYRQIDEIVLKTNEKIKLSFEINKQRQLSYDADPDILIPIRDNYDKELLQHVNEIKSKLSNEKKASEQILKGYVENFSTNINDLYVKTITHFQDPNAKTFMGETNLGGFRNNRTRHGYGQRRVHRNTKENRTVSRMKRNDNHSHRKSRGTINLKRTGYSHLKSRKLSR